MGARKWAWFGGLEKESPGSWSQQLRVLAALPKVTGSIPFTHSVTPGPGDLIPSLASAGTATDIFTGEKLSYIEEWPGL